MLELLLEPFSYGFMRTALVAMVLIGVAHAVLGIFVVLRRMAFIGEALAHTTLPGVVAAHFLGLDFFYGALGASVVTSLGISWVTLHKTIKEDTAIGVVFTGMLALGIFMMSTLRSFRDFTHILFGNILGVAPEKLWPLGAVSLLILGVLFLIRKELVWTSVDPVHSATQGLSPHWVRTLLLLLLALAVTVGIQVAGVVLTVALLVTPPAAASLLTERLGCMMLLSVFFSLLSGIMGLYASFYLNVSSGASIVLTATLLFTTAWIVRFIKEKPWNVAPGSVASSNLFSQTKPDQ